MLVAASCTEPVEIDEKDGGVSTTGGDNGGESGDNDTVNAVSCQEHSDCDSRICGDNGACESENNIVYVSQINGTSGRCGDRNSPCQTLELALSLVSTSRKNIFVSEGVYVERLFLSDADLSIVGDGNAVLSLQEEDRDMDKPFVSVLTLADGGRLNLENLELNADGYDDDRRFLIHGVRLTSFDDMKQPSLTIKKVSVSGFNLGLSAWTAENINITNSFFSNNSDKAISIISAEEAIVDGIYTTNSSNGAVSIQSKNVSIQNSIFNEDSSKVVSFINDDTENFNFSHNTLLYRRFTSSNAVTPISCDDIANVSVTNNIIVNRALMYSDENITGVCPTSNSIASYDSPGDDNFWADPQFVDIINENVHLSSDSPAIDAASTLPDVVYDFDGDQRPMGAASDIGADEAR